jgi:RNA polymerase subunit RPABC4/transcription elongation factor Spt4
MSEPHPSRRHSLFWIARLIEVRLRFVIVLLVAFVVVGRWETWRNYWDKWTRPLFGGAADAGSVSADTEFFCPMCPGVLSDWPAICPVCHMDLVTRRRGEAIVLPDGTLARMQLAPYRIQQAGIHTTELRLQTVAEVGECLALPESAVIDTGSLQVVYVESMPGMFDGVAVKLGPRVGDLFPVREGLKPGQRVATAGAFLIDAETRLNPSLAVGYFGAAGNRVATISSSTPRRRTKKSKLSAADLKLVEQQKICPVTGADLNSMGGAVPVDLTGRRVFICCAGCEAALRKDPEKVFKKLTSGNPNVQNPMSNE